MLLRGVFVRRFVERFNAIKSVRCFHLRTTRFLWAAYPKDDSDPLRQAKHPPHSDHKALVNTPNPPSSF